MQIDVSIIFVNYHTSGLLAASITSILKWTSGLKYEIIVIDNNSEEDLKEELFKQIPLFTEEIIKIKMLPSNIGFGKANNEGIKIAKGRNILFLNPDTLLVNNAIKLLSDFLDTSGSAGACGGNLVSQEFSPLFSFKRISPGILWEMDELLNALPQKVFFGKNRQFNYSEKPLSVKMISGADLMVKKRVLDQLGGFDNDFFLYYEDTDLCHRILKAGGELYNLPNVKIIHLESRSFGQGNKGFSENKIRELERARKIYNKKKLSPFILTIADFIYYLFLSSRIKLVRNQKRKEYYEKRKKYFLEE